MQPDDLSLAHRSPDGADPSGSGTQTGRPLQLPAPAGTRVGRREHLHLFGERRLKWSQTSVTTKAASTAAAAAANLLSASSWTFLKIFSKTLFIIFCGTVRARFVVLFLLACSTISSRGDALKREVEAAIRIQLLALMKSPSRSFRTFSEEDKV